MKNIVFKKMLLITIMGTGLILGGILSGLSMGCGSEGVGEDSPVVIQQLATGNSFTCVLLSDQTVKCWGYNAYGQLGNGTHASLSAPTTAISGLTGVTSIVSGSSHVCALLSDGTVKCWGSNNSGELGDGTNVDKNSPTMIASLTGVTSIVSGASHVCALLSDQTVKCWGYNYSGELGDGTTTDKNVPTLVSGLSGVTSIAAGDYHTCVVLSGGTVKCWGYNYSGQLGDGSNTDSNTPPSSSISNLSGVSSIIAGSFHTCVLLSDQTGKCWGLNDHGQLGDGTNVDSNTPPSSSISGLSGVVSLMAGSSHTCALLSDHTVKCWGDNGYGQLGDGTNTSINTPPSSAISGLSGATLIAARLNHTCVGLADHTMKCWGDNSYGQLSNGQNPYVSAPSSVTGLGSVNSIKAGASYACAVISDGTMKCWGYNGYGQLGDGTYINKNLSTTTTGLSSVTSVALNYYHTCSLLSDQTVKCWGSNSYGQLGDGTNTDSNVPPSSSISGLSGVVSIAAGYGYTCALLSGGTVKCWGSNAYGQLGDGTNTGSNVPPSSAISGLSGVTSISTGYYHTCALLSDQTVKCWGYNGAGELGDGTNTDSNVPPSSSISGLSGVTSIATGYGYTCALLSGGTVKCWGKNTNGQLGDATTANKNSPVTVSGLSGVTSIVAGDYHTCAILSGGTVKCWGYNTYGQLGDGTTTDVHVPPSSSISGLSGVTSLAAGSSHTCALLSDQTVKCWGWAGLGELGRGDDFFIETPGNVLGL